MLNHEPESRLDCNEVLKNPYFWNSKQKLKFLQEVNNLIIADNYFRQLMISKFPLLSKPWYTLIDERMWQYLIKYSNYNIQSTLDIVRLIRNVNEHWNELRFQEFSLDLFKAKREGFWKYIASIFPDLLVDIYMAVHSLNYLYKFTV